ncbi:MAG TPA: HAMP domain-containing sensor histidine kinase [Alphaproteobacteria bacterium]|nr:HAMP domain-containing sensor histidine kinase [Alphaproteobacteria bacterium]
MELFRMKGSRKATLLDRYSERVGHLAQQQMTEGALLAAKQNAEQSATLARQAMLRAQAANRTKSEILANVSHELRTPLNAIIGFSELICTQLFGPDGREKYLEYARDIHDSGKHLLGVINDILEFAKIDAGEQKLYEDIVDLGQVLSSCRNMISGRAHKAGVKLDMPCDISGAVIWVDERKLKQILLNLLSNAVKFTPPSGRVSVTLDYDPEWMVLKVEDTGIGIAPEDIERALAPFQQVDSDLNRRYEGTGLGLTITTSLLQLHGGRLQLESTLGSGTTATVRLPIWRVKRARQENKGKATAEAA